MNHATSVNVGRRLSSLPSDRSHQVVGKMKNPSFDVIIFSSRRASALTSFLSLCTDTSAEFDYCQRLATQISNAQDLPLMCHGFSSVSDSAKRQPYHAQSKGPVNPIHVPRGMASSRLEESPIKRTRIFHRNNSGWRDLVHGSTR